MADFELRAGDTLPSLEAFIYDGDVPANLTDADVQVIVHLLPSTTVQPIANYDWNHPPPPPQPTLWFQAAAYTDPASPGRVGYDWTDGQTDTAIGEYIVSWQVTTLAGKRTYPTEAAQTLVIVDPAVQLPRRSLVSPDDTALTYNLGPLLPADRDRLRRLIDAATAEVEDYLHRSVKLAVYTEDRLLMGGVPNPGASFDGILGDLWGVTNLPLLQVLSIVPLSSGYFRITYIGGLDGTQFPRIMDWIAAKAASKFRQNLIGAARIPNSITVEGQSLSYGGPPTIEVPPIKTLDRWRVRTIYSRPRVRDPYITRS